MVPLLAFDHALRHGRHCNIAKIPLSAGGPLSIKTTFGLILFAIENNGQSIKTTSAELISSRCFSKFFATLLA